MAAIILVCGYVGCYVVIHVWQVGWAAMLIGQVLCSIGLHSVGLCRLSM